MPIPRYFVREKMRALKEREKMLAHILAKGGRQEENTVSISLCKNIYSLNTKTCNASSNNGCTKCSIHFMCVVLVSHLAGASSVHVYRAGNVAATGQ